MQGNRKVRKTISTPILGGLILGALSYLTTAANFTVQISEELFLGPWEIFNVLSAALFGPIGLLITELGLDVSGYVYLIRGAYPAPHDAYFIIGNYVAHIVALIAVASGYWYIYRRMNMPHLLSGWVLIMGIYYLVGVSLSVVLHNIAVPGLGASFSSYFSSVRLEFLLVTFITSLILLALPDRYLKPQWYEPKQSLHRSGETPNE